jgi:hypothetical protein
MSQEINENQSVEENNNPFNEDQLILMQLIQEKEKLVSEGKYLEANEIKSKIDKLRKSNRNMRTQTLNLIQNKQNEELEENYNLEYQKVSDMWDNKLLSFIENGNKLEDELAQNQNSKLEELINDLTSNYPSIKFSREYLNLKQIEKNLVKQERYQEANYYKSKCDKLEREEIEKYNKERSDNIRKKADAMGLKFENEKKVLREKLDRNFELLKVQRDKELKQITSKYKNRKTELNGIHKKQRNINENDNLLRSQNLNVVNNKGNKSIITLDSKYNNFEGENYGNNDNIMENNNYKNADNENEINYNEKNFFSMGDNDDN